MLSTATTIGILNSKQRKIVGRGEPCLGGLTVVENADNGRQCMMFKVEVLPKLSVSIGRNKESKA